jgi:TonB family protein
MRVNLDRFSGFQTLEFPGIAWTRWAGSLALHAGFLALLIAVPWSVYEAVQPHTEHVILLLDPIHHEPRPFLKTILVRTVAPAVIPPPIPVTRPIVEFQAPKPRPVPAPQIVEAKVEAPLPAPTPIQQIAVARIEVPKPAPPVKVGGFGDPNGVQPSTFSSRRSLTAAKLGSFDLSEGNARGKGSSGNGARVVLAGFGDAGATAPSRPGGDAGGLVRSAGFGEYDSAPAAGAHAAARAAEPLETPVEITFKPKPAYTPEAREKRIEGEVLLEVLFSATGQVHILQVTHGLGFGLDENARNAAAQIRFKPGTRGGAAVDMKGIVHIVFALS